MMFSQLHELVFTRMISNFYEQWLYFTSVLQISINILEDIEKYRRAIIFNNELPVKRLNISCS